MSTVSKKIADDIVAGKYGEDHATRIVEYTNAWGKQAYGVTFRGQRKDTYLIESEYIHDPKIYWDDDTPAHDRRD